MNSTFRIIDIHLHIGWANNNFYSPEKLWKMVSKKIVFGFVSSLSGGTISQEYGNKETYNFIKKHPKKLKGIIWVNPYNPDWEKDAQKYLRKGFLGIKLQPSMDNYSIRLDFLKPVFDFACKHKLPLFVHTSRKRCQAKKYEILIKKYPSLKIILYHAKPKDESLALAKKYRNVFLEISSALSSISEITKIVRFFLHHLGSKKILFGTDGPIKFKGFPTVLQSKFKPKTYSKLIKEISKNLKDDERNDIFFNNSNEIFNLKL